MDYYARHFQQCLEALLDGSCYWQAGVFTAVEPLKPVWAVDQAPLMERLLELSDQQLEQLQASDKQLLNYLMPYWPVAKQIRQLIQLPYLSNVSNSPAKLSCQLQQALGQSVPRRKWQQIQAFAHSLTPPDSSGSDVFFIDACCGKGHLSRYIAALYQSKVLGVDYDEMLLSQAQALVDKHKHCLGSSQLSFQQGDVLTQQLKSILQPQKHHLLALHACGKLHRYLLQTAVVSASQNISLAPCCYHKFYAAEQYEYEFLSAQPLPSAWPGLSLEQLRTSVRQSVTSSAREREQRRTLQAWRLGFDLLQREIRGRQMYLPVPSVSPKLLKLGFVNFVHHVGTLKNLALPSDAVIAPYEHLGWQRYQQVSRLDLMRMAFRRLMEVTLVLDMACYLQERGYQCQLGEFCSMELSPRNIVLNANR